MTIKVNWYEKMSIKKLLMLACMAYIPCIVLAQPKVLFQAPLSLQLTQHPCSQQALPILEETALIAALACDYPNHDVLEILPMDKKPGFVQVKLLQEQKKSYILSNGAFCNWLN